MSRAYVIISDVHYGIGSTLLDVQLFNDLERIFAHFAHDNDCELILAGDLFDYWMEYPNGKTPAFGLAVLELIGTYFRGRTHFIPGNHDVWEYGFFTQFGIKNVGELFHPQGISKSVAVFHGDGLHENVLDLPLPFLHRTIRKKGFVKWFQKLLPAQLGWFVMKWFSRFNNLFESRSKEKDDRVEMAFRKKLELSDPATLFICGHEHQKKLIVLKNSAYLNTGNFSVERTFAYLSADEIKLLQSSSTGAEFKTLQRLRFT